MALNRSPLLGRGVKWCAELVCKNISKLYTCVLLELYSLYYSGVLEFTIYLEKIPYMGLNHNLVLE